MSHARVEEVSDSDISDPEEMDVEDLDTLAPNEVLRAAQAPARTQPPPSRPAQAQSRAPGPAGQNAPQQVLQPSMEETEEDRKQREAFKSGISLYPIYFDASRTKKEGRRVGKEHAVENPLAREIAEAVYELGYKPNLEPSKMHPRDWANPGRVRILGSPRVPIKNSE